MHISFIPYGERSGVERLLREMEAQKHPLIMWKGKKRIKYQSVMISGQIRDLPFGIKEYIVPKESLDLVLNTFATATNSTTDGKYGINFKGMIYPLLRKGLKLKKLPKKYKTDKKYTWTQTFISVIVLGTREDNDIVGTYVDDKGWTHEAL